MKRFLSVFVVLCYITISVFANGSSESVAESANKADAKMVLRYSEVNPASDERAMATQEFADIIKEKTNGRIEILTFPGAQLGDNKTIIQGLQFGSIDMTNEPPTNLTKLGIKIPYLNIFSLPFLFRDESHAINVMNGEIGEKMLKDISEGDNGLIALDTFVAGARNFFTKKPVNSLKDLKGMKIRVQQAEIYMDIVRAFGASPTPTSTAELYSALQTGVVDGAEQPIKGYANSKYYEVAKYYSYSNYLIQPSTIFISSKTWNKLSAEDKQLFKETAKTVTENFQKNTMSSLEKQLEELNKGGVVFSELSDYDKWVEAVQPVIEKYGKGFEPLIQQIKSVK